MIPKGTGENFNLPYTTKITSNKQFKLTFVYYTSSNPLSHSLFNQTVPFPTLYEEILKPDATLPACTATPALQPHSFLFTAHSFG